MDFQLKNVISLGLAFFLIFFSFQTSVFIQQTVVNSIKTKPEYNFHGDGYISLCITYVVFAISNWASPSIIAITGLKLGMFLSAITYALYSASFIYPTTTTFYLAAILIGLGAGPLWAAQGNYLAENSEPQTTSRNSGLFWSMLQSSMLFGNMFVYLAFNNKTTISDETRYLVYGVLTSVCILGMIILSTLRQKTRTTTITSTSDSLSACGQFRAALKLSITPNMLLITMVSLFTGQLLTFITGVYGTALGSTWQFGLDAKKYIGLAGVFIGLGEIGGGSVFGLFGAKVNKFVGRDKIAILGLLSVSIAFGLVYINLPPDSPLTDRAQFNAIIEPEIWIAMVAAILLGLGDACFNTQIYSILISLYKSDSLGAFALFKFAQSLGSSLSFLYSTKLNLYYQLYLLTGGAFLATISFCIVDSRQVDPESIFIDSGSQAKRSSRKLSA